MPGASCLAVWPKDYHPLEDPKSGADIGPHAYVVDAEEVFCPAASTHCELMHGSSATPFRTASLVLVPLALPYRSDDTVLFPACSHPLRVIVPYYANSDRSRDRQGMDGGRPSHSTPSLNIEQQIRQHGAKICCEPNSQLTEEGR